MTAPKLLPASLLHYRPDSQGGLPHVWREEKQHPLGKGRQSIYSAVCTDAMLLARDVPELSAALNETASKRGHKALNALVGLIFHVNAQMPAVMRPATK